MKQNNIKQANNKWPQIDDQMRDINFINNRSCVLPECQFVRYFSVDARKFAVSCVMKSIIQQKYKLIIFFLPCSILSSGLFSFVFRLCT